MSYEISRTVKLPQRLTERPEREESCPIAYGSSQYSVDIQPLDFSAHTSTTGRLYRSPLTWNGKKLPLSQRAGYTGV